ncbi:MAG: penicillin-binding protein 2 [Elusimicrobiota bacterium]
MKAIRNRIVIIFLGILVVFITIGFRLFQIQIVNNNFFSKEVAKQSKKIKKTYPLRGNIYDRRMTVLATSMPVESCYIEIDKSKKEKIDADFILEYCGMSVPEFLSKIQQKNGNKKSVLVKRKLLPEEVFKIKSKNLPGVYFEKEELRFYPENSLANYVVGIAGMDNNGLSGIEYQFNSFLTGESNRYVVQKDGKGREILLDNNRIADENRGYVVLTIDSRFQYVAESILKKAQQTNSAKSLTCIIQNPYTGEILAMATIPAYDPNKKILPKMLKNPAINDAFEPGSVFKIVTTAAAIEKHPEVIKEQFFCENGSYKIAKDVTIHDHEKYGLLSFEEIFAYSSNIGFAKLSREIGKYNLWQYARAFGFGTNTGIELPGETEGRLISPGKWSGVSCEMISFGQEISATALQIVNAYSAIANGGILLEPKIVTSVVKNNKKIQFLEPVKIRRVISPQTASTLKKMLEAVVDYGTGTNARISNLKVAGKTGTAQKYDKQLKKYSHSKYVSLFAGFLPSDVPKVTILVVVDEPKSDYWASSVAAPIFRQIAVGILQYLGIQPEKKLVAGNF